MATKSPLPSKPSGESAPAVFATAPPWQIRDEFQRLVVGDIHGPAFGSDEVLAQQPICAGPLSRRDARPG